MREKLLEAKGLTREFGGQKEHFLAVEDVSFSLYRGEALGIVGESGSGKSTLVRMLTGLLPPTEGTAEFLGQELTSATGRDWKKIYQKMQLVFQFPKESFDPGKTLGSGIGESLRNKGFGRKETREKVEELLLTCGLPPDFAGRYPREVSGGECQRAAVARALAVEPDLLICDEATSALDVTVQKQILELLLRLKKEKKLSFLFISHDLALVQAFCDRVLVMYQGKIVEQGTTEKVIQRPEKAYTRQLIDSVL